MAELIVSTVAAKLLEYVVQSTVESAAEQIAPYFGGREKLKKLERTMNFIQARLHDAERRGEGENEALVKEWLLSLKAVLFRLEDLFEEVAFADQENEQQLRGGGRGKYNKLLPKRLSVLLSRSSSPLKINKLVAEEAKAIMQDLESIKSNMTSLNFRELYGSEAQRRPLANRTIDRNTCSYVVEEKVIGRDEDKSKIVGMLLDPNVDDVGADKNVSVIPIVGIGGLGKTTLAQLVFNDENVQLHFQLKAWACISEISTLEEFAGKILKSLAGCDYTNLTLEEIQTRLRGAVNDKKYLLVLDDVWDEDRERWLRLKGFLCGGRQGSRIIVTSRSRVVAGIMGTVGEPYELEGLSKDKSWDLFKSLAFKEGQEKRMPQLTSIGREIVEKCANVPLAIRAIAAILYCKDTEQEWRSFKDMDLLAIEQRGGDRGDRVMSTLKLSYDYLEPHLKECFAYCSLFPKDYEFCKERLIYHWMAQGYIESSAGNQASPEDVGHGYYMELLRRSFFQEVVTEKYIGTYRGTIVSCKMHDLMNDLARKVAGDGCLLVADDKLKIKDNTHVSHVSCESLFDVPSWLFSHAKRIRSVITFGRPWGDRSKTPQKLVEISSSLRYLRTLDLSVLGSESLSDSIGEMKHLRYLRMNVYRLRNFPQGITRLQNLQILELLTPLDSFPRIELPTDFGKLISLRNFIVDTYHISLNDMPPGFGQLTALQKLSLFVVGENNGLDALANMVGLAGELEIRYEKHRVEAVSEAKAANLMGKKVTDLVLAWTSSYSESTTQQADEEEEEDLVLQWLQPPPTIRCLTVRRWAGRRFPYWGMDKHKLGADYSLPCLVSLRLERCWRCEYLPPLWRLPCLKFLTLDYLGVKYIEMGGNHKSGVYFPSLERLKLEDMHELKGWSKEEDEDAVEDEERECKNWRYLQQITQRPLLPEVAELEITKCRKLVSLPLLLPRLESLRVSEIHGKGLQDLLLAAKESTMTTTTTTSPPSSSTPTLTPTAVSRVRKLVISSVQELEHLSISLSSLEELSIDHCSDLTCLTGEGPSSLRRLTIHVCGNLRDISGSLQHLSDLEELSVYACEELDWGDMMVDDEEEESVSSTSVMLSAKAAAWQGLKSLRSLRLIKILNLQSLPRGLGYLTTLEVLVLDRLKSLRELPEWMGNLTQLRQLQIDCCHELSAIPVLPVSLRRFHIFNCKKLRGVSDTVQHLPLLEDFDIRTP